MQPQTRAYRKGEPVAEGFPVSTGLIVVLSLTLYLEFKKRDWL